MFHTVLIANRGEIACRVIDTCRKLGIRSVAVYSDADAHARHVRLADVAVPIGPAAAAESYLVIDKIIAAAKQTGAQAIHPGYGFLAENAAFARACADAGIVFIGPPASAIDAMGDKSAAKSLMEKAGVPLTPGYHGDNQEPEFLKQQADAIGYPVLIKASAGGGGKGMRRVDRSEDFAAALVSCKREAAASFGNDHVLIEKFVLRPRHIEIQIFGDAQGHCVYLHERDCSVQRRHQKVLEEAPAPGMSDERRKAMGKAAVEAARAVGYVGAGTVEFITSQDGEFYFMEMNTRLQVEHPVTEMITGQDLVEWQLRVAAGGSLPLTQEEIPLLGHAIEARIYAEDTTRGFLPSIGNVRVFDFPQGTGMRVDTGIDAGDAVTPYYDPMLAKLIVHGSDREDALRKMRDALASTAILGLSTNIAFLQRLVLDGSAFSRADLDTGLIDREEDRLFAPAAAITSKQVARLTAALLLAEAAESPRADSADPFSPWACRNGWRLGEAAARDIRWHAHDQPHVASAQARDDGWDICIGDDCFRISGRTDGTDVHLRIDGADERIKAHALENDWYLLDGGALVSLRLDDPLALAETTAGHAGDLGAPMPGRVVALLAEPGPVAAATPLLVLEAMKMEHTITAPVAGTLDGFLVSVDEQVTEGMALVDFTPGDDKS